MAEPFRLTLAYGGQYAREDVVVWGMGFNVLRSVLPFGKVPVALINDHFVAQSGSLARFAAKAVGAYPSDTSLCARCDAVFELGQELCTVNPMINCYHGQHYNQVKAWYFDRLPESLDQLENQLIDEKSFFCGSETPTHADFNIFHMMSNIRLAEPEFDFKRPYLDRWFLTMESLLFDFTSKRPALVGIGTDPGLLDSKGTFISQRQPYHLTFLDHNGHFQSYQDFHVANSEKDSILSLLRAHSASSASLSR